MDAAASVGLQAIGLRIRASLSLGRSFSNIKVSRGTGTAETPGESP